MKKLFIYLFAITVGVLLSFPLVTGFALEQAYQSRVASMPAQPGITIASESYARGWFKSHALVRVSLDLQELLGNPELGDEPFDILVKSELHHGPILFTDLGIRFGLGYGNLSFAGDSLQGLEKDLAQWLTAAPLTINTIIYFDQSGHTELDIASYTADEGEDHVRFGGLNMALMSNGDLTRFDATLLIQPSSLITTGLALEMAEASGSMNYQGTNPYTMVGESVFSIPQLAVNGKSFSLVFENINLNNGSQLNQGKMDYFQTLEIGKLTSPFPVSSAGWHMEFIGISPQGLEHWSDISLEIQRAYNDGTLPLDEMGQPQLTTEMEQQLGQVAEELLQPGLGLVQRFDVGALGEDHHAELTLNFDGLPAGVSWSNLNEPLQLLPAFSGELNLNLHEAAVMNSQFASLVLPYQQQGLLMSEQGKLVLQARLKDGILMLNGSPVPLEAMLQSAMAPDPAAETDQQQETPEPVE